MRYLLDTCTVSYFFRKDESVILRMKELSPSNLAISTITVHEIEYGLALEPLREAKLRPLWQAFLDQINVITFDIQTARIAADIRAYLKKQGNLIGAYDILIAATAISNQLVCVTSNKGEFNRIPQLMIEDWRFKKVII